MKLIHSLYQAMYDAEEASIHPEFSGAAASLEAFLVLEQHIKELDPDGYYNTSAAVMDLNKFITTIDDLPPVDKQNVMDQLKRLSNTK